MPLSSVKTQVSDHKHQQNYWCPFEKTNGKKVDHFWSTASVKMQRLTEIVVSVGLGGSAHTKVNKQSFLTNEPMAKGNAAYLSRPMLLSLWPKMLSNVSVQIITEKKKKKALPENKFLCSLDSGMLELIIHPSCTHLLHVLILISKVKVE